MGVARAADFNASDTEGVSYFQVNQKRGLRWSAARGFLKPVMNRPNLRVETGVVVERVLVAGGRATGVALRRGDRRFLARARGEVVLCAGAIGTPHLLQLSGIGPAAWLGEAGVAVVADRPGVGRNLQDHLQLRTIYRVSGVRTLNETYRSPLRRGWMGLEFLLRRRGPLTMAPSQLGLFTRSDPDRERPNLQFHVQPLSLDRFGEPLHRFPAITVSVCNLQPKSRGFVRLRSPDAADHPAIAPCYLAEAEDRRVAADSIRATRRLMRQPALARYRPEEVLPGSAIGDDDEEALARAAGDIGTTIFHPVGTARMGLASDPMAVVDNRLRVFGVDGLRVVDASVMPTITSGNTNTPTVMLAARAARFF
jgi:choline dehydrogenase-like flavoprotein